MIHGRGKNPYLSISKKRRIRSESWDLGLFEIENRRLVAKGEEPFDTLEAWRLSDEVDEENDTELPEEQAQLQDQAEKEEEEENIPETDPLLFEAGKISWSTDLHRKYKKNAAISTN